ncbi:hypothetical protein VPAG_00042 [Vibrio phage douglas 12A4]|uniref:hypothetical protein n=1 Tax=Vibrio phage douglas 12A4 TaxID=573171 RepID=UPI0002C09732|nr:hypothetical protein VPAG_00042 [Vibrio phage douglas 12A4]AGG58078.1 hypothetical protein VPAG_00042 [Vibrio phage douglas 12A4]
MLQKKLFVLGDKCHLVTVLGKNTKIKDGIYVRFPDGGTDTTWDRYLFDVPEALQEKTEEPVYEKLNSEVLELREKNSKAYALLRKLAKFVPIDVWCEIHDLIENGEEDD